MHGLIFVTWEKYLAERFQVSTLKRYREAIGETSQTAPLTSHVYEDKVLLLGVETASRITHVAPEKLLREFGRYFIINALTRHLCAYLLTRVNNARDLLLTMREAHEQMSLLPDGLTPPLFEYDIRRSRPNELIIIYNSPRKLCTLLLGAIEGAAQRYGEKVRITESLCMQRGSSVCRFEIRFSKNSATTIDTYEYTDKERTKRKFAELIFTYLPAQDGITLEDLRQQLELRGMRQQELRPALVLEALHHLQYSGLIATTANQPGDQLGQRRYWRAEMVKDKYKGYRRNF